MAAMNEKKVPGVISPRMTLYPPTQMTQATPAPRRQWRRPGKSLEEINDLGSLVAGITEWLGHLQQMMKQGKVVHHWGFRGQHGSVQPGESRGPGGRSRHLGGDIARLELGLGKPVLRRLLRPCGGREQERGQRALERQAQALASSTGRRRAATASSSTPRPRAQWRRRAHIPGLMPSLANPLSAKFLRNMSRSLVAAAS